MLPLVGFPQALNTFFIPYENLRLIDIIKILSLSDYFFFPSLMSYITTYLLSVQNFSSKHNFYIKLTKKKFNNVSIYDILKSMGVTHNVA